MLFFFQRYSTPFISGFFLISLISGVALFFHVGPNGFRAMHEILSMVLIAPFVAHLWKNWRPLLAYFKRSPMIIALVISAIAAGAFLIPVGGSGATAGGPPQFQLAHLVLTQPLAAAAPALGKTPEGLAAALTAAGFTVAGPDQALTAIATASGKSEMELAATVLAAK